MYKLYRTILIVFSLAIFIVVGMIVTPKTTTEEDKVAGLFVKKYVCCQGGEKNELYYITRRGRCIDKEEQLSDQTCQIKLMDYTMKEHDDKVCCKIEDDVGGEWYKTYRDKCPQYEGQGKGAKKVKEKVYDGACQLQLES